MWCVWWGVGSVFRVYVRGIYEKIMGVLGLVKRVGIKWVFGVVNFVFG